MELAHAARGHCTRLRAQCARTVKENSMAKVLRLRDTTSTTGNGVISRQQDPDAFDDRDQVDALERVPHIPGAGRDHRARGFRRQTTYLGSGTFRWHSQRRGADRKLRARGFLRIRRRHDPDA
jgi:hypothetical protein